jgi:hypothetical protein
MHPPEVKQEALRLVDEGLNDCEISRRIDVPRSTVREWRAPRYKGGTERPLCPRCWHPGKPVRFSLDDYSELLAMYLGDGCISRAPRTWRLRISLDAKYPGIIEDGCALLTRTFPENPVAMIPFHNGAGVNLSLWNSHLPCLLPQHGPGLKHRRRIAVEDWQLASLIAAPWPFIRGCIRTDGCVFVNRTGRYEYLSYAFANMSRDIANLLAFTLRVVGVEYRLTSGSKRGIHQLRINRRDSVALMLEQVGVKA